MKFLCRFASPFFLSPSPFPLLFPSLLHHEKYSCQIGRIPFGARFKTNRSFSDDVSFELNKIRIKFEKLAREEQEEKGFIPPRLEKERAKYF